MGIDWFTLVAQIINFLILVFALKYLLYDRIITAMDERERRIVARMDEAEEKRKEAETEAGAFREKRTELEEKREGFLEQAKEEAEKRRKELVQAARDETKTLRAKWKQSVEQQKDGFLNELRRRAGQEIHAAVRRVLADLANEEIERHMVDVFITRLAEMDEEEKESLAQSIAASDSGVLITSTFAVPENQRSQLAEAVRQAINGSAELRFETAERSICGIELKAGGHKLAWNFEAYVGELEETVSRLLEKEIEEERNKGSDAGDEEEEKDDENDEG